MSYNDFDSLEGIYDTINSGQYNLSPIEIGNLTLKLGRMVDKNPTEYNVLMANSILMKLLQNNDMIVWEALIHKFEYIALKYCHIMPDEMLANTKNLIRSAKHNFLDWLEEFPPQSNINILRRVEHSTLHYDFDGFVDALSINESQNFYEIASVPVEILKNTCVVPSRNVVSEDRPQRSDNWNHSSPNGPHGPNGPRYAYATMPPPRPPRRPPYSTPESDGSDKSVESETEKRDWKYRYHDILDLITISVLNSLTSAVKPMPDGCQLVLKPEILDKRFEPYDFCYGYYYSEDREKNDNAWSQQKNQIHIFEARSWARIDNSTYSTSGDMSVQEYACKFLELVGLTPTIGADDVIIVHGTTFIKGFFRFFDLKNLKNAKDLLEVYYQLNIAKPIMRKFLECTSMDVKLKSWINRDLLAYTPAMSPQFWNYETRKKDLMANINLGNLGQGRI